MAFEQWPYTNIHNLNLDWILERVKDFKEELESYTAHFPQISPKNDGQWSAQYTYEPNEIVSDGLGVYIAKKEVPAGTPVSNTEYWLKIATLTEDVQAFEERMQEAETNIDNLSADMVSADERITALENAPAPASTARRILLLGDSWCSNNDFSGFGRVTGWGDIVKNTYLPTLDIQKVAKSGCGIAKSGNNFNKLITDNMTGVTMDDPMVAHPETITDIYLGSGLNDTGSSSLSALRTAFATLRQTINTYFPLAKVHIIAVGWTMEASRKISLATVWTNYQICAGECGWSFEYGPSLLVQSFDDFIPGNLSHLKSQAKTAAAIASIIQGGSVRLEYIPEEELQMITSTDDPFTFGYIRQMGDFKRLRCYRNRIGLTTNITIQGYTSFYLGSISGKLIQGGDTNSAVFDAEIEMTLAEPDANNNPVVVTRPCTYVIRQDTSTYTKCNVYIYLHDFGQTYTIRQFRVGMRTKDFSVFDI